jgi:hypothetical protein
MARPQFHHGGASLAVLISGAGVLQHEGAEGGLAVMAAPISFALAYLRRPPSDEKQKGKEGGGSARGACRKEKGGKGERGCSGGERRGWVQFGMCYTTGGAGGWCSTRLARGGWPSMVWPQRTWVCCQRRTREGRSR